MVWIKVFHSDLTESDRLVCRAADAQSLDPRSTPRGLLNRRDNPQRSNMVQGAEQGINAECPKILAQFFVPLQGDEALSFC